MLRSTLWLIIPAVLAAASAPARAAFYLEVDDIRGDVRIDGYEEWIEVDNFGIALSAEVGPGGERTGRQQVSDFAVAGSSSIASVHLFSAAAMHTYIS